MKTTLAVNLLLLSYSEAWHQPQSVQQKRPHYYSTAASTKLYETPPTSSVVAEAPSQQEQETMGLPQHLYEMEVSTSFQVGDSNVEKVSSRPPIFVLRNFLTKDECQNIMDSVSEMEPGQTVSSHGNEQRKNSHVAWLDNVGDGSAVISNAAKRAHDIFLGHQQVFHVSRGVEPLQVVRYDDGGEYVLHQDGNRRLLTVLYYLNGAGETWFPLADSAVQGDDELNRLTALKKCEKLTPGRDGVLVSCEGNGTPIQQGDAVAFYSYFTDATCDWNALHAGLPVSSTKWIGNHFFHHVPFSDVQESPEQ